MREIKFRAWHNGHKYAPAQMLYDEKPGDCLLWKSQGQNIEQLMQYTGLKDKNGKDIYEGDIAVHIEFESEDGPYNEEIGVVKWEHGTYYLETKVLSCITQWLIADGKNTEVIGNIYENPDILPQAIARTNPLNEMEAE